jgi:hypothetical protein
MMIVSCEMYFGLTQEVRQCMNSSMMLLLKSAKYCICEPLNLHLLNL